ncbi:MAG: hypothetical protein ACRDL3_00005, partial [Solirubrobacterales bacterium]
REAYPDPLERLVDFVIPFVAPFDMLRGIALDGASIAGYGSELVVGAAWLVGLVTLATRTYRLMEG